MPYHMSRFLKRHLRCHALELLKPTDTNGFRTRKRHPGIVALPPAQTRRMALTAIWRGHPKYKNLKEPKAKEGKRGGKYSSLANRGTQKSPQSLTITGFFTIRVTGFEPAASWSQTTRATSCATPGRVRPIPAYHMYYIPPRRRCQVPEREKTPLPSGGAAGIMDV